MHGVLELYLMVAIIIGFPLVIVGILAISDGEEEISKVIGDTLSYSLLWPYWVIIIMFNSLRQQLKK